jgi:hypothetical protein
MTSDYLFLVLNATLFLILSGLILWLNELDVYVNFLMVIDLGVFFVLAALLVNFLSLFQAHSNLRTPFFLPIAFIITASISLVPTPQNYNPGSFFLVFYN